MKAESGAKRALKDIADQAPEDLAADLVAMFRAAGQFQKPGKLFALTREIWEGLIRENGDTAYKKRCMLFRKYVIVDKLPSGAPLATYATEKQGAEEHRQSIADQKQREAEKKKSRKP